MGKFMMISAVLLLTAATLFAQQRELPYAKQQYREIKALSAEEIEQFLKGSVMGYAMVAELNHYPNPKHVLDMADELGLTEEQRERTEYVVDKMRHTAILNGEKLVDRERRLDDMFRNQEARDGGAYLLIMEIAEFEGEIRAAHVRAHIAMKDILTPQQIARYDALRGHSSGTR